MSELDQAGKGRRLHELHCGPEILVLPNAWDAATAKIMEQAGFPALATTSAGIANACGYPDGERMGRERMLEVVARIVSAVGVPVTADLEAGYGPRPEDVAETARGAVAAGAVGMNLEDGLTDGSGLMDLHRAAERVRAAREAADATGVPFVLNARTDPYLFRPRADPGENFAEALRRAAAYREQGADCIFVPGHLAPDTIAALAREIDAPLNVLGAFSGRPGPDAGELQRLGVRRVSIGGSLSLAVFAFVRRACEEMRSAGSFAYAKDAMTNAEMNRLMGR
jgi:2-methylisocitrate lyase-like PEP mutase family enzyme